MGMYEWMASCQALLLFLENSVQRFSRQNDEKFH